LVYCGQTFGMQVGLGPSHIVLDGDPAPPPEKGGTAALPLFSPLCPARSPISATAELLLVWKWT